ncbi:hypothetical protein MMSP_4883 [Mycobacterium sp. 012931]|nr:hypothetical protein MMSP_4883 [Mycobacterium sp. 012931]
MHGGLGHRDEKSRHLRVLGAPAQVHADNPAHRRLRIRVARQILEQRLLVTRYAVDVDGRRQHFLAREMVEKTAIADTGIALDLPQCGGVDALAEKPIQRGLDDRRAPITAGTGGCPGGGHAASSNTLEN